MNGGTSMITTIDNPYNPFEDFSKWLLYDKEKGYDSCEYLSRLALTSDSLSDEENNEQIENAIDTIIRNDILGIYVKVNQNNFDKVIKGCKKLYSKEIN